MFSVPEQGELRNTPPQQDGGCLEDSVIGLSGSTICCGSARARSISWNSNINGVRTSDSGTLIAASRAVLVDVFGNNRCAISILRLESLGWDRVPASIARRS